MLRAVDHPSFEEFFSMNAPICHYLLFEPQFEDEDGVLTLEAVASVRPSHWSALQTEMVAVLDFLVAYFGHPATPLDEGGVWDAWLQIQVDDAAPVSLSPQALALQQWRLPDEGNWLALTLTLAYRSDSENLAAILTNV
jgi:hypothetical protein